MASKKKTENKTKEIVTTVDVSTKLVEAQQNLQMQLNIYNQLTQGAESARQEVIRYQGEVRALQALLPQPEPAEVEAHEHAEEKVLSISES